MAAKRKSRKSAFVPKLLVRGAIVGVIPACALVGCGSEISTSGGTDAATDRILLGVAAVAYPAYEAGRDAGRDVFLGVAAVAYPAYESGVPDATTDSGAADAESGADVRRDVFLGVAAVAYPAYEAGKG